MSWGNVGPISINHICSRAEVILHQKQINFSSSETVDSYIAKLSYLDPVSKDTLCIDSFIYRSEIKLMLQLDI